MNFSKMLSNSIDYCNDNNLPLAVNLTPHFDCHETLDSVNEIKRGARKALRSPYWLIVASYAHSKRIYGKCDENNTATINTNCIYAGAILQDCLNVSCTNPPKMIMENIAHYASIGDYNNLYRYGFFLAEHGTNEFTVNARAQKRKQSQSV